MAEILRLDGVSLVASVGMDYLLEDISFKIEEGEKIAIIGASGSGKTSLLRLLNRLVSPVKGTLFLRGVNYQENSAIALRRDIILVSQEPKLLGMIGKDALIYPLQLQQLSEQVIRDRLYKYTNALQIPQGWLEKNELQLSLGQRQLLTITRALMLEPSILLLDEPTSALDMGISDRLLAVLDSINQEQKTTIFMVNHQLDIAALFAQRVLYFSSGKLILDAIATPEQWQAIENKILREAKQESDDWNS